MTTETQTLTLRNDNPNTVSSGKVKIKPGRAKRGSGEDFETIAGYNGVVSLEGDEADAALRHEAGMSPDVSPEATLANEAAAARNHLNHVLVSAPLQVVVGDDAAPLGPPSGEVSTKLAEAEKDPVHAAAFGPNEARREIPHGGELSDGDANTVADVHNAQARATQAVEEVAQAIAEGNQETLGGNSSSGDSSSVGEDEDDDGEVPEFDPLEGNHPGSARKATLVRAARFRGLDESGSVPDLRQRITEHDAADAAG